MKEFFKRKWVKWTLIGFGGGIVLLVGLWVGLQMYLSYRFHMPTPWEHRSRERRCIESCRNDQSNSSHNQNESSFYNSDEPLLRYSPTVSCELSCADMAYKPVIYLYPLQEMEVHVHLDYQGELIVTYPEISDQNDWMVIAQPDGTLIDQADGLEYSYLFRE
jgi:hypothetical protein